jgi:hypothetical protein
MTDQAIRDYLASLGRKGAASANSKRTPAQRKKIAKAGAAARWAKAKKEKGVA